MQLTGFYFWVFLFKVVFIKPADYLNELALIAINC